jgi:hypothetical protein
MSISTFLDYPPNRGILWLSLTDTGRFLVRGTASDSGGGVTETYSPAGTAAWTAGTTYPCRIDSLGGGEGEVAERVSDRSTHVVTIAAGTIAGSATIASRSYPVYSTNNDFQIQNRGRYEITALREHTGEMATRFEVTDKTS